MVFMRLLRSKKNLKETLQSKLTVVSVLLFNACSKVATG